MAGLILRRDVLAHPILVVQGFGWRVFFAALFGSHVTFLAVVAACARGAP